MNKISTIIIDALILFAVSTVFVLATKFCFGLLESSGQKDDPLVTAIHQDKIDNLRKGITEDNLPLNNKDGHQRTPLMHACYVNYSTMEKILEADKKRAPMVVELIKNGADPDLRDGHEWTALMWAAWSGMPEVSSKLIESGANLNATGIRGHNALSLASMRGNVQVVKQLIDAGATLSTQTEDGSSPVDLAQSGIFEYPDKKSRYDEIIGLLQQP